ncbi:hypothetical protein [Escherichia coli]|uniref:hypothetical protein n=1 Tax=Escherichia coli TaxID=562 RepID=UPI0039A19928
MSGIPGAVMVGEHQWSLQSGGNAGTAALPVHLKTPGTLNDFLGAMSSGTAALPVHLKTEGVTGNVKVI